MVFKETRDYFSAADAADTDCGVLKTRSSCLTRDYAFSYCGGASPMCGAITDGEECEGTEYTKEHACVWENPAEKVIENVLKSCCQKYRVNTLNNGNIEVIDDILTPTYLDIIQKHSGDKFTDSLGFFTELINKKQIGVVSSVPGYSTHCETNWLSPLTDWTKV